MSGMLIDRLLEAVDSTLAFDPNVLDAPIAVLWPDEARQWEGAISDLQQHRRIVRFGPLDAERHQGPGYWLRCVIAGTVDVEGAPEGLPIVYLPGVSRGMLSSLESVPSDLAVIGALQYRCQWFNHHNGKDWTIRGLLSNKEVGSGLKVAGDEATSVALVVSLPLLLERSMTQLDSKYIDVSFLNGLLNPDPNRSLLDWLDDPVTMRGRLDDPSWSAFVTLCKQDYGYDPGADGEIVGARLLGCAEGQWAHVWRRYCENPSDFPGIPSRLSQAQPAEFVPKNPGAWPGLAEDAENRLRVALVALAGKSPQEARDEILTLEETNRARRGYVWANLGMTTLALALEHLAAMATITSQGIPGNSVDDLVAWYSETGWRADGAVLAALDEIHHQADIEAVEAALRVTYRPWLDHAAKALQAAVGPAANSGSYKAQPAPLATSGEVVVFVDGLRFDVGKVLTQRLEGAGLDATLEAGLAALPTVTQTSKPALVPIDQSLLAPGAELDARRAPDGPSAQVQVLRALMSKSGIQVLEAGDTGDSTGSAWTEAGEIDHRGHDLGSRVAHEIDAEVERVAHRIEMLLDDGWSKVTVVTDHGWLLLPGGLPKNEDLPVAVAAVVKGRCARIKPGVTDLAVPTVPWHWDPDVRIATAAGISCFKANQEYEHGGVSPQECIVPRISVTRGAEATSSAVISKMKWRGLTLVVDFEGLPPGAKVDLRATAGDPSTSIAEMGRVTSGQGKVILLVGDDDLEGQTAQLVVVASDGALLLHRETTVGVNR